MSSDALLASLDAARHARGYLGVTELLKLADERRLFIPDPFSVLISRACEIGLENTIYPGVFLTCGASGALRVGERNVFHANSLVTAETGPIYIGSDNEFGPGGFNAAANRPGARISIGSNGRYNGGAAVFGVSDLRSGSQILGQIVADTCHLEEGGSFRDSDPESRAGLLKGSGIARGIKVPRGHVISANGPFNEADLVPQIRFHPKATT